MNNIAARIYSATTDVIMRNFGRIVMRRNKSAVTSNQSTEKAFAILEYLASCNRPVRLSDICEALGMHPSTASRFLTAMINCGYAYQDVSTSQYMITYKICRLANIISNDQDVQIQKITHPILEELVEIFQESACVSVERNMQMIYIDVLTGNDKALLSRQRIGNAAPMHCTGNGKLCLLNYESASIDHLIDTYGLPGLTRNTITTKEELMECLEKVRESGVAYDDEECEEGMSCVAYPIYDYTSKIIGGVSISGPTVRIDRVKLSSKIAILQEAAQRISEKLGYEEILAKADSAS